MKSLYKYSLQRQPTMELAELAERRVSEPAGIAKVMRALGMAEKEQEEFVVFFLDTQNNIKGYTVATVGLVDRTQIHAREVYRNAILEGCTRIVVGHNHPSGDPTPSALDISCTRQLNEAGKIIGIDLLDHVIIGQPSNPSGREFMSFRQENLM
jgi:DNA repair protein RadC